MTFRVFLAYFLLSVLPQAVAADLPGIPAFIDEMVSKHQFPREELVEAFGRAERRQAVIDLISKPATLKPWTEYRPTFVNPQRIEGGLQFWQQHAETLQRAERQYGVPQEIIVALIGVETRYGRQTGRYGTFDALTTLAFDYPRRAEFFRGELEQYLLLSREQKLDLFAVRGSYAGALGIPQFMPGSWRKYAVDFGGDGRIDLLSDTADAIGSVANYLKQYGWQDGEPVAVRAGMGEGAQAGVRSVAEWAASGIKAEAEVAPDKAARLYDFTVAEGKERWLAFGNFDALMRYNNSTFYAMSVFQLAEALRAAHHGG